MIYKNGLGLALLAFSLFMCGHADAALTRVGNKIGMKNMPITLPLDTEMRRQGVPDQCRIEAHKVLGKYIVYGFHDKADLNPRLDIICDFTPTATSPAGDAKGFNNKKLGQAGVAGGLSYVRFRNKDGKDIERFMYHKPEIAEVLECRRNGVCIKLTDGGRSTVLDNTQGPITEYKDPADRKSENKSSGGGMFASITPSKSITLGNIINVAMPNVLQGSGTLTSKFGHRESPGGIGSTEHKGIDIGAPNGTPILAYGDGQVVNVTQIKSESAGYNVTLRHADGTFTQYFHMQSASPYKQGDVIKAGTPIGKVGNTGHSTGNHLHFGMYKQNGNNRQWLDPLTAQPPSGTLVPQNPQDLAALGAQVAATDAAMELFSDGGATGDMVPSMYCITGVSPATSVEDCQTNVNIKRAQDAAKGKTPANE